MSSANKIDIILFQEALNNSLAKRVRYTAIILAPGGLTLLGVGPKQVAKETILGHFSGSGDLLQLGNSDKFGGKTTVHAQNFIVN